ncbi:MAG: tetratricopeptide repeat protein [Candidatus Omnitrophota bacterium]|jgi:tetratricopeptide (TPR) repeat protein
MKKRIYAQVALIALLGFLVYFNSLSGKFIWDDYCYVKNNSHITSFSYLPGLFTEDIGAGSGVPSFFYRPFQMVTYMIDYALWGLNEFGYHLINLILHIIVSLCIYWMVTALFEQRVVAFLTSLLFIAHPAHVEAIASISGRAEPLVALFMLVMVILYSKQLSSGSRKLYALTLLSFVCALLSKENALIAPLLILLYHFTFTKKIKPGLFLSILAVSLSYIIIRISVLSRLLTESLLPYTPDARTFFSRIPGFFSALVFYLRILVLPFDLRVDYGSRLFRFSDPAVIIGMAITVFLTVYAFKRRRKDKLLFFSVIWFYITLLPSANIYKINESFMKEHWLYIPSIGFFLVLARSLVSLYGSRLKAAAVFSTVALLCFYSYLTARQNVYWSDPIVFMKRSMQYSDNYVFYEQLGLEYYNRGNFKEAADYYKEAIRRVPGNSRLYEALGVCYKALGRYKDAIAAYQRLLGMRPAESSAYYELGDLYDKAGEASEAVKAYSKAIELSPAYLEAHNNLAALYADTGEVKRAITLWERAVEIDPDFAIAHFNLAVFYYQQREYRLAVRHCDKVLQLGNAVDPEFLRLLEPYRTRE